LCPGSRHQIELVEADLTSDNGWEAAVADCDYILHVASPFPLEEPKDPNELIVPAVEGTLRVLRFASQTSKLPRRVVVTSSVASVSYGHIKSEYTEADWTVPDSKDYPTSSYVKSKVFAEKAAWEFVNNLPANQKFELATVCPSFVLGPMLSSASCSSADLMKQLLLGELPGLPDIYFNIVSVYDVARTHLLAMTHPDAGGKRFIASSGEIGFREMAALLDKEFRPLGYRPTSMHVPGFLMHFLAFFGDRLAKGTVPMLGVKHHINPVNTKTILGLPLAEDYNIIKDMAYASINAGVIPDKSKDKNLVQSYVRPEFDTSMIPNAP
jgi:dihydroflavonol-4-reductase